MSTAIMFDHTAGWRNRAKIIEQPRGNPTWEVVALAEDGRQIVLRLGATYRVYAIEAWASNDKAYGTLSTEDSALWPS